jgi:hypothetical protein
MKQKKVDKNSTRKVSFNVSREAQHWQNDCRVCSNQGGFLTFRSERQSSYRSAWEILVSMLVNDGTARERKLFTLVWRVVLLGFGVTFGCS